MFSGFTRRRPLEWKHNLVTACTCYRCPPSMLDASFVIVCMGLIALGLLALRWSATNPGLLKATPLNIKLFHQDMATLSLKGSPSRLLSWGRASACKCQRRTPKEETIINWVHPTGSFTPSLRKPILGTSFQGLAGTAELCGRRMFQCQVHLLWSI